jgi:hypothetical protein
MTSQIYRAFWINEAGHILGPPEVILCDRDADAIEQATKLIGGSDYAIQLWLLARLVIRLPSHDPERAAT